MFQPIQRVKLRDAVRLQIRHVLTHEMRECRAWAELNCLVDAGFPAGIHARDPIDRSRNLLGKLVQAGFGKHGIAVDPAQQPNVIPWLHARHALAQNRAERLGRRLKQWRVRRHATASRVVYRAPRASASLAAAMSDTSVPPSRNVSEPSMIAMCVCLASQIASTSRRDSPRIDSRPAGCVVASSMASARAAARANSVAASITPATAHAASSPTL